MELSRVAEADSRRVRVESESSRWAGFSSWLTGAATGLALFSGLAAAIAAHSRDELQGPMIAVIALLPWASAEIVATFAQATTARTRVEVARERIDHLLRDARHIEANKRIPSWPLNSPQSLKVSNLSVRWDRLEVVRDVHFEVVRGQTLALVGPSGSGKSTIAAALLGLVEYQGSVALDGVEIGDVLNIHEHVSALLQTTHVFSTSLRENLHIAQAQATDDQLFEALDRAGLRHWRESLVDGLDTRIGDGHRGMSGGEIQRLGIARLLLTRAEFLILDEPTEHLDSETAQEIWSTLRTVFVDRGLLVITHDADVARLCDESVRLA